MKLFYNIESWTKSHWILLILFFVILLFLLFIIFWSIKKFFRWKKTKHIKKIWKNNIATDYNIINLEALKINFNQIEITKKINDNKRIAWHALVEILTRVVTNKYDLNYGNPKEALKSLHIFYTGLRDEMKKYPSAFKSNIVIITLINNEIRPFLTKWNFIINEKYKNSDTTQYIEEFIKDYNKMFDSIIKNEYIQNLLLILSFDMKVEKVTIPDGVENKSEPQKNEK